MVNAQGKGGERGRKDSRIKGRGGKKTSECSRSSKFVTTSLLPSA